jgi:hypothetical protein
MHITTSGSTQVPLKSSNTITSLTTAHDNGSVPCNSVCNAFNVALLLTGSMTGAEGAVLEAVAALEPQDMTSSVLLCRTIESSVRHLQLCGSNTPIDRELVLASLPMELRKVLEMDVGLRQSFVLRILVGMSADVCGLLLGWDRSLVDTSTCAALRWLAKEELAEDRYSKCSPDGVRETEWSVL